MNYDNIIKEFEYNKSYDTGIIIIFGWLYSRFYFSNNYKNGFKYCHRYCKKNISKAFGKVFKKHEHLFVV